MNRKTPCCALLLVIACATGTAQSPRAIAGMQKRPIPCTADSIPESTHTGRAWIDGIVPYEFSSTVNAANRTRMLAAMTEWEKWTAVQFVPRSAQPDWIFIQASTSTNNSATGRIGGRQIINIVSWNRRFTMAHELCHALGFKHEHTRPDRDMYIRIETANIQSGRGHNFSKQTTAKAWGPYDFDSVMHYTWNAFAIDRTKPTITVLPPNQGKQLTIGQRTHLSIGDIDGMRTVYGRVRTTRISASSSGTQGIGSSIDPSISADGRYVTFSSGANNLVSGDTNRADDVFVRDVQSRTTTRVSLSSSGTQGNGHSYEPRISADGRHVTFHSRANNLVSGDTNAAIDVFVHDRETKQTTRVSVSSSGTQSNGPVYSPMISAGGRYVAFRSKASNLVSGDTNATDDVFVHDRQTKTTTRVSVSSGGTQGNGFSEGPSISADGRYVAFRSMASNLVSGDTNAADDVFVRDRKTKTTTRVSVNSSGTQGNGFSYGPGISADGRDVTFYSRASNLVSGDTNATTDVFVRDRKTKKTTRVSLSSSGTQGNAFSIDPSISADGRYVAFYSGANNLVSGDTNASGDVFVHDRQTNATTRVSVRSSGTQGNAFSIDPSISADGRYVAFRSRASNLVFGRTNLRGDVFVRDRLSVPRGLATYGTACLGSLGAPTIHARARARSEGNTEFAIHVSSARSASTVFVGIGISQATVNIGRGCNLYISFPTIVTLMGTTDPWGTARIPLPVPTSASYKGVRLYAQGFVADPNGAWYGLAITGGLSIVVQ